VSNVLPNGRRKFSATGGRPQVGLLTKGNANSTSLAREWTSGLGATIGNPANPQAPQFFRPKEKTAAALRAERVERRVERAKPCPGCGMKCDIPKTCFCW
jgi:hypothetical protein